jgi:lon-related putative ATP-dependent protease
MEKNSLQPELLYKACQLEGVDFTTTDDLDDIDIVVGQDRAVESIHFGIRIAGGGYNIYALAPSGTGKLTVVKQLVEIEAERQPVPSDWCYVNNFSHPSKPIAIEFSPGRGKQFKADIEHLIDELSIAIPAAFDGNEYRSRAEELEEESKRREIQALNELRSEAAKEHIALIETPTGFAFAPVDKKDEVINSEQFQKLSEAEQMKIQEGVLKYQQRLQKLLKKFPDWRKETKHKLKALNREVAELAVGQLITEVNQKYSDMQSVLDYLEQAQKYIVKHVRDFIPEREQAMPFLGMAAESNPFSHYQVNLIVDHSDKNAAPVVYEDHPNYANLLGRVEYQTQMGSLWTNFTMIKPGAMHKANGGYLILDVHKLLLQPYAWENLKRILQSGEIRIESLERSLSLVSTTSLEPEPIPLDLKVILIGDRLLYYLLSKYDPEFHELFKVSADFADSVARDENTSIEYARLLATIARKEKLKPITRQGVARIIEYSSRLVSDKEKLSTHLRSISDLLNEANYWAENSQHETISVSDVQQAIDHKIFRSDRIRERIYENIHRGTVMIDTDGKVAGQINGLSVLQLGEFMFGQPSRITATTRIGNGKIVDIERETELGGALHTKGVMILSSFIAARYARKAPFSMVASLVFEQSYGPIDGDSASLAELCVILSSLAQLPLRQDLAVTGSINQLGQVQPIGGVNEKIEGFFDICNKRGLTGVQGVVIPESNIKHLMLRWDVVHAVKTRQFHVYAVQTLDQALELLTGREIGKRDEHENFSPESINGLVEAQLQQFTTIKQSLMNKTQNQHE